MVRLNFSRYLKFVNILAPSSPSNNVRGFILNATSDISMVIIQTKAIKCMLISNETLISQEACTVPTDKGIIIIAIV